jgi:hypothetical protein
MDRRTFLKIGCLASLGWSPAPFQPNRKLILVWLGGGHSNLETFDPKPNAPEQVRGQYGVVQTTIPGIHLSDRFPRLASLTHRIAIFRTVQAKNGDHYGASYEILNNNLGKTMAERVGKSATIPYAICEVHPPYSYMEQAHRGDWIRINREGGRYVAPSLSNNTINTSPIQQFDPEGVPSENTMRRKLLASIESWPYGNGVYDCQREAAMELLLGGGKLKACFDLPGCDVERFGSSCTAEAIVLAQRLTRAGVGAVTVVCEQQGGWDAHVDAFSRYRGITRDLDFAIAALVQQLDSDTVCLVTSEFGRTPKINGGCGRDHWPTANTALLFGGGIVPGVVVGRTDQMLHPRDRPVPSPWLCNTVLAACGHSVAANEMVSEVLT